MRWDSDPSGYNLKEVNEDLLRQYMQRANTAGRISFSFDNKESILKKLELVKQGKLLKAAEVLFCNKNSLKVQLAVFAGNDKLTFLDIQMYESNIFDLIEKSEQYLKEKMNWRAEISSLQRQEIPEIPVKALRESIINSFCHRNYYAPESNYIAVFKNRIEISNPGRFPEGLKPEDFIKGKHESVLRNPLIAEVLYKSKEIEHWGSGLKRIYDECKANKIKVAFETRKTGFAVIFSRSQIQKQREGLNEGLNEGLKTLLSAIKENPGIKAKDLSPLLNGRPVKTIERQIKTLIKNNLIERRGSRKTGGYYKK